MTKKLLSIPIVLTLVCLSGFAQSRTRAPVLAWIGVSAQDAHWKYIGPGVRPVVQIVPDRKNPSRWYLSIATMQGTCSTTCAEMYRSLDGARKWEKIPTFRSVLQIAVQPLTSEVFVVNAETSYRYSIWVSADAGKTFQMRGVVDLYRPRIVLDPSDPETIYGFNDSTLLISHDGAQHWKNVTGNLPKSVSGCGLTGWSLTDLVVSPFNRHTLYVTTYNVYYQGHCQIDHSLLWLIYSTNRGRTWRLLQQLPRVSTYRFHTDPAFPDRAFMFGSDYDNAAYGTTWTLTAAGWSLLSQTNVSQMISIPGHPQELMAMGIAPRQLTQPILKSDDGGNNWQQYPNDLNGSIQVLESAGGAGEELLGGTPDGVFRRVSNHEWMPSNAGIVSERGTTDAFYPNYGIDVAMSKSKLFAVQNPFLLRKNQPDGMWEHLVMRYTLEPNTILCSLAVSPVDPNRVILSTGDGVYSSKEYPILVSKDGGQTWQSSSQSGNCGVVTFDPISSSIVYLASDALYRSTDSGMTFQKLKLPYQPSQILIDENDHRVLYAVANRIYRSGDSGQTFQRISSGLPPAYDPAKRIASLPQKGSYLAVIQDGTLFRTVDEGQSWQKVSSVELGYQVNGDYDSSCYAGTCSPSGLWAEDSVHYFITTNQGTLFETTDSGNTWKITNRQFPGLSGGSIGVFTMTDPSKHPFYIFTGAGLFREEADLPASQFLPETTVVKW